MLALAINLTDAALSGREPSHPLPFILLAAGGFVIGVVGHMVRSKTAVITGIAMVLCATVILPFALFVAGK